MSGGVVLDASTALAWAFEDESSARGDAALDALTDGFGLVPSLWPYELANGLRTSVRRGRMSSAEAAEFLVTLEELDIRVEAQSVTPAELLADALAWDLTAYDAAYVRLARDRGLPLATGDSAMAKAAVQAGAAVFRG